MYRHFLAALKFLSRIMRLSRSEAQSTVQKLIEFENQNVTYQEPQAGVDIGFIVKRGRQRIVVSAPHGARCFRPADKDNYHEEDEFTAAIVNWLHERLDVPAILMVRRSSSDPNRQEHCPYKAKLAELIEETKAAFVLDIHGASEKQHFAVDLGCRGDEDRSCPQEVLKLFKRLWKDSFGSDADVSINHFAAKGQGTIASFIVQKYQGVISVLQIEINAKYRIPRRKPDATSKTPYPVESDTKAQTERIWMLLQVLEKFIGELASKSVKERQASPRS